MLIVDVLLALATVFGGALMLLLFLSAAVLWLDNHLEALDDEGSQR